MSLSRFFHANAQRMASKLTDARFADRRETVREHVNTSYSEAIMWYKRYVALYPYDEETAQHSLLDATARPGATSKEQAVARREQIEHGLAFASGFPLHPQATLVRLNMAKYLLDLGEYARVKAQADVLLTEAPEHATQAGARDKNKNKDELALTVKKDARELRALSAFELADYAQAEADYLALGRLPGTEAATRQTWSHQMAICIFKQGERAVERKHLDEAVDHFARLSEQAPTDPLREQADYDRATYLLQLERWPEAIAVLRDFQKRFPRSEFKGTIAVKLAHAFEATESWADAAVYYLRLAKQGADPELRRVSLFRAGELLLKGGERQGAVRAFREYAHTYARPVGSWLESQYHLTELYQDLGLSAKRDFWLRRLIKAHKTLGDEQTERSRYLAASAQTEFARRDSVAFEAIALKHPITRSLKQKQKALKRAAASWQAVAAYQVAPFATEAQFRIARLYQHLAAALMASERPAGLSALEVEQYDLLLEEQAYPLEEQAIVLHEKNLENAWQGVYDEWVSRSVEALASIVPVRYARREEGTNPHTRRRNPMTVIKPKRSRPKRVKTTRAMSRLDRRLIEGQIRI
ncbi:MAG: tetratricopeptide repeat protein [Gammaproteobacteria bacterium]